MERNHNNNTPDTLESVSALIKELTLAFDARMKASDEKYEKERAEREKSRVEYDARLEKERAEREKSLIEYNARFEKERAEFYAELQASTAEHNRRMKNLDKTIGGMGRSNGMFAEEYFFNSFENKNQTFFGERFDAIQKNVKSVVVGFNDEYDIMMVNGSAVGIIEVKYRAQKDVIPRIINKANTFRINFPQYQNHRIYLALATLVFDKSLEEDCKEAGIAIVKQVGETIVIDDGHLKVF